MVTLERRRVTAAGVTEYARDVVEGRTVAGPYVRQACARHLSDLELGAARGLTFDEAAAQHALDFLSLLQLADEQPFELEPFQVFIAGSLFGWYRADGHRRFRRAYIEIGKGNGKTPLAAGIGLYGLCADGHPNPEIYSAATTRTQAHILFTDAKRIVQATPELDAVADVLTHNITVGQGLMRPIDGSGKAISGPRVHMGLIDEVHEHPTSTVIEILRAGTKRNLDALILEITNSGSGRSGPCWEDHQYSINVLDGIFDDDAWFAYVCALDKGDDWRDPAVWPKANPGVGTILPEVYIEEQVREAVNKPAKENIVKRLNACIWTEQLDRWLSMELWRKADAPAVDAEALRGERCFGGLDLASRRDFTAFVLYFPATHQVLPYFWIPEDMTARTGEERERINEWARQGLVRFTPGNITDYDVVRDDIEELAKRYQIEEIGYDTFNATQLATQLEGLGATVVPLVQGVKLSEPAKELEALVAAEKLRHGGHPVLEWMASNVAVYTDKRGNISLDREHSGDRIDGIVALVMAIARWIPHKAEPTKGLSFYVLGGDE